MLYRGNENINAEAFPGTFFIAFVEGSGDKPTQSQIVRLGSPARKDDLISVHAAGFGAEEFGYRFAGVFKHASRFASERMLAGRVCAVVAPRALHGFDD